MGVSLSENEVTARGRPAAARIRYFFQQIVASGAVFVIDDTEGGTLMMEDSEGREVLPVWPTLGLALGECDPEADEVPGTIEVVTFARETVPQLADAGVRLAIFPIGVMIAVSATGRRTQRDGHRRAEAPDRR